MKSSPNGSKGHHQLTELTSPAAALDLTRKQAILDRYQKQTGIFVQLTDISSYSRGRIVNAVGAFLQVLDEKNQSVKDVVRNSLTEQFSPGLSNLKSGQEVEIVSVPLHLVGDGKVNAKDLFENAGLKTDRHWDLIFPAPMEIVAANESVPVQDELGTTNSKAISEAPTARESAAE